MTYHISRDYNPETTGYVANKFHITAFYQLTLFLHKVLNYSIVGQTNWNIGISPFLISSGSVINNQGAGINFGASYTYEVSIPNMTRLVTSDDIGRILILKSLTNPTKNSGLFKITGINDVDNRFIIDYRSSDEPPVELSNSMNWWLYEKETSLNSAFNNDGYSSSGYAGSTGNNSKIILQSPHASAWQLRLCVEPISFSSVLPNISIAVGYDGDSSGNFLFNGNHTHISQFLNENPSESYINTLPGFGYLNNISRLTIAGDDTGQSVFAFSRSGSNGEIISFGIPDNEESPIPQGISRLFCYAKSAVGSASNNDTSILRLGATTNIGMSNKNGIPAICGFASYVNIDGYTGSNSIISSNAGDSPFINSTEVLPVEIWSGITTNITLGTAQLSTNIYQINQIMMGTVPFIRLGRANFGNFTTTTDSNKSWLHIKNGIYLQYNGPTPI